MKIIRAFRYKEARDYSCLTCPLPTKIAEKIASWGKENIKEEDLIGDGLESQIHVTVKYGIHTHDITDIKQLIWGYGPINIILGKISLFQNESQDVVKIEVDSPKLHEFNKFISDHFDHTDTFPVYIPHITLGYLKPGLGKKFDGNKTFYGKRVKLEEALFSGNDYRETIIPLS